MYSVKDSSELSFVEMETLLLCLGPLVYLVGHPLQVQLLPWHTHTKFPNLIPSSLPQLGVGVQE